MMGRGRPPIGDKAMSSAERQRRFLEKIRGISTATQSSVLEAENAKLKSENAELKNDCATLKRLLDGAEEHIKKLEARRERPRPQPGAQPISSDDITALKRKNKELRLRLQEIAKAPKGVVYMKQGDRRKIFAGLHPDGVDHPVVKRRHEIAFQIINKLFDSGTLREIEED